MSKKMLITIILVIIIGVGAFLLIDAMKQNQDSLTDNGDSQVCTMEAKICPDGTEVGRTGPNCEFAECPTTENVSTSGKRSFIWTFTKEGEDETGTPRTRVAVITGETEHQLGTYNGSCAEIDGSSWTLVEGEKNGVICWWAGGGTELGIFEEDGKVLVKKGELDEGTAESSGVRGNFETLITIN